MHKYKYVQHVMWKFIEYFEQHLHDFLPSAAGTCMLDWVIRWKDKCTGSVPIKVAGEKLGLH